MSGALNEDVRRVARALNQRMGLLPMVREFIDRRHKNGELSFDDQMSLAADISTNFPDVGELERSKYKVVLLDEYQDTSQSQVRMLSTLFGNGHPVMAVGDPCQAIYTWRGASAGTISAFSKHFPKSDDQSGVSHFDLLTTFRNDKVILELANQVSSTIRTESGVVVPPLKARNGAGAGELACGVYETIDTEAQAIAAYFKELWNPPERSFAVLVRKRSQIAPIESALRAAGLPVEVIGLGGLIHVPEVAVLSTMNQTFWLMKLIHITPI
jgi:DNA helicase-2/ATP-dependent DNA helicase PcrA